MSLFTGKFFNYEIFIQDVLYWFQCHISIVQSEAIRVIYKNFYKHKCNFECQKMCLIVTYLWYWPSSNKSLREGLWTAITESHHSSGTSVLCLFGSYLSDKKEHVGLFFDFKTGFRQSLFKSIHSLSLEINLFKPTSHMMHHQFNIQQLYILPTLYLCVLYLFENKQRLVPLTA